MENYYNHAISRWILLRMRDVSYESCKKKNNRNEYFMFNNFFPPQKPRHSWESVEKYCTHRYITYDNTIRCMRFACWITKATKTHSEHETIIAFLLQQRLHEGASMLRCTYIAYLIVFKQRTFWAYQEQRGSLSALSLLCLLTYWSRFDYIFIKFHIKKSQANKFQNTGTQWHRILAPSL